MQENKEIEKNMENELLQIESKLLQLKEAVEKLKNKIDKTVERMENETINENESGVGKEYTVIPIPVPLIINNPQQSFFDRLDSGLIFGDVLSVSERLQSFSTDTFLGTPTTVNSYDLF